jgi:hypothetical protein
MRTTHFRFILLVAAAAVCVSSCSLFRSSNPNDVEDEGVPSVASGACDGVPVIDAASLMPAVQRLSANAPASGSVVALEGTPRGELICTAMACSSKCCNGCGHMPDCTYSLAAGTNGSICLSHERFECGGMDCDPWCRPFSYTPKHRYRFVGKISYILPHGPEGMLLGVNVEVEKFCRID